MTHPLRLLFAAAALIATLAFGASGAHADLAPPDTCTSPGQPCNNAGPQFNAAGTCVMMTCTKQVPSPDGGMMPMSYDCNRCQAVDGGVGGGSGSGGSGSAGSGGSGGSGNGGSGVGGSKPPVTTSSGCSVAPEGSGSLAGLMAVLVALSSSLSRSRERAGVRANLASRTPR